MDEAKTEFDADLESAIGLDVEPAYAATPNQPAETPAPTPTTIEAGGRRFRDVAELSKSYGSLWSEFSKSKQDFARSKGWIEFDEYLGQNPQLRDNIRKIISDYHGSKEAGAGQKEAAKAAGIPPEYAKRIDELEARWEDAQLERETSQVRARFKLSDTDVQEVLSVAHKHGGIPLEVAARTMLYDRMSVDARSEAEQRVRQDQERKQNARVGSSASPKINPSSKNPAQMNEREYNAALDKELDGYGIR